MKYLGNLMRCLAAIFCLLLVSACGQRAINDPEAKLYYQSSPTPSSASGLAAKEPPNLQEKAIVILRVNYSGPNDDEYRAVAVSFTTQSIDTPYAGRILSGESDYGTAHRIGYVSDENVFLAMAVEPGTYRYIHGLIGDPAWRWPRFSPTRRIEFTVEAGEAIYVGDLKLYFNQQDLSLHENAFGTRSWRPLRNDYRFAVSQDDAAARAFYDSLEIESAPPLQVRLMTNESMPYIERYQNPNCNGFFNPRYSSRGFCK